MTEPQAPAILFVEHVVWEPGSAWRAALDHLASRFARVAPLDVDAVLTLGPLHAQRIALDDWAATASADLDRELGRFLDEHLSMHLRPDPTTTRAVRALAAAGPVHAASALPARAAEAILRHAGCWRSTSTLHADVTTADAMASLIADAAPRAVFAGAATPLPDELERIPLSRS